MKDEKLIQSVRDLKSALQYKNKALKDHFYFSGLTKSFETCLEYAWKYFKTRAQNDGLEVYSPRDAIKIAGQSGLIDNVELWLKFLRDRNLSVHDYIGISKEDYIKTIENFLEEVSRLID